MRYDSEMCRFYRRLRQRGKPGNVMVVVVMRKLLLHLNTVYTWGDFRGTTVRVRPSCCMTSL